MSTGSGHEKRGPEGLPARERGGRTKLQRAGGGVRMQGAREVQEVKATTVPDEVQVCARELVKENTGSVKSSKGRKCLGEMIFGWRRWTDGTHPLDRHL